MTDSNRKQRRADLDELLLTAAIETLDEDQARYLDELLKEFPDVDRNAYERTAAAILLASLSANDEPMPSGLKDRILLQASGD